MQIGPTAQTLDDFEVAERSGIRILKLEIRRAPPEGGRHPPRRSLCLPLEHVPNSLRPHELPCPPPSLETATAVLSPSPSPKACLPSTPCAVSRRPALLRVGRPALDGTLTAVMSAGARLHVMPQVWRVHVSPPPQPAASVLAAVQAPVLQPAPAAPATNPLARPRSAPPTVTRTT